MGRMNIRRFLNTSEGNEENQHAYNNTAYPTVPFIKEANKDNVSLYNNIIEVTPQKSHQVTTFYYDPNTVTERAVVSIHKASDNIRTLPDFYLAQEVEPTNLPKAQVDNRRVEISYHKGLHFSIKQVDPVVDCGPVVDYAADVVFYPDGVLGLETENLNLIVVKPQPICPITKFYHDPKTNIYDSFNKTQVHDQLDKINTLPSFQLIPNATDLQNNDVHSDIIIFRPQLMPPPTKFYFDPHTAAKMDFPSFVRKDHVIFILPDFFSKEETITLYNTDKSTIQSEINIKV